MTQMIESDGLKFVSLEGNLDIKNCPPIVRLCLTIGGVVIDLKIGGGLPAVPLVASLVTVVGILFTLWGAQQQKRNNQQGLNN
ncbi:hypothetical protein COM04_28380 [Bacillus wiedmannii]|nr:MULTISPECIES: hypothetical protein [Bacillus cereus group]MCU7679341.1 hypothetical protein [Bacillus thuringiensis]PEP71584.1 hypothetical protein CN573_23830 [Bacillus wiedmannii]PGB89233.1 hypothetical protein COM04_28380 [Bacillus wiedmannii]